MFVLRCSSRRRDHERFLGRLYCGLGLRARVPFHTSIIFSIVHENVLGFKILGKSQGTSFSPQSTFLHPPKGSRTGTNDPLVDTDNAIFQPVTQQNKRKQRQWNLNGNRRDEPIHCFPNGPTGRETTQNKQHTYRSAIRKARWRFWVQKYAASPTADSS